MLRILILLTFPLISICAAETPRVRLASAQRWVCYYGSDRQVLDTAKVDLLVLDSDGIGPLTPAERQGRLCLAYVSCGEAESHRFYWPEIAKADWVLKPNPDWAGAHLVDLRCQAWRDLIIQQVARRALEAGYDGLMLDTLDTVDTLVQADPLAYEGVASAAARLVHDLRLTYPKAVLVANGGLAIFSATARDLDGVMIEGLRSTYDFSTAAYRRRRADEITYVDRRVARVRAAGLPLFALEYIAPEASATLRQELLTAVSALGVRPFLGQIKLDTLPKP